MTYPRVVIERQKLKENVEFLAKKSLAHGIEVAAVTKVFSADPQLVALYASIPEVKYLADSRLENIRSYPKNIQQETILLRIPMLSEVDDVVSVANISLNSHFETIQALNEAARRLNKCHQIILMVDLGDLREGIFESDELMAIVENVQQLNNIELVGLGVNLTCYGAVIPTEDILQKLITYQQQLLKTYQIELPIISGGNSSSIYLLDDEKEHLPQGVNLLRLGEVLVLGTETAYGKAVEGMHRDVFTLQAEIVEYRTKPSYPIGKRGLNAFGETPEFEDKGLMQRGIVAIGQQDIDFNKLTPRDSRLEIIGASSDHMIIDFTAAQADYKLGSIVEFDLSYGSLLKVFTSKYVQKIYQ